MHCRTINCPLLPLASVEVVVLGDTKTRWQILISLSARCVDCLCCQKHCFAYWTAAAVHVPAIVRELCHKTQTMSASTRNRLRKHKLQKQQQQQQQQHQQQPNQSKPLHFSPPSNIISYKWPEIYVPHTSFTRYIVEKFLFYSNQIFLVMGTLHFFYIHIKCASLLNHLLLFPFYHTHVNRSMDRAAVSSHTGTFSWTVWRRPAFCAPTMSPPRAPWPLSVETVTSTFAPSSPSCSSTPRWCWWRALPAKVGSNHSPDRCSSLFTNLWRTASVFTVVLSSSSLNQCFDFFFPLLFPFHVHFFFLITITSPLTEQIMAVVRTCGISYLAVIKPKQQRQGTKKEGHSFSAACTAQLTTLVQQCRVIFCVLFLDLLALSDLFPWHQPCLWKCVN